MSWRPIRSYPTANMPRCLIYVPRRSWTDQPEIGEGQWTGGGWLLLTMVEGVDARAEHVDPTLWHPMPEGPTEDEKAMR
ncbi:MAG: hypothetical protein ACFCUR_20950 [Rhodomicrobiaceae bacterium]